MVKKIHLCTVNFHANTITWELNVIRDKIVGSVMLSLTKSQKQNYLESVGKLRYVPPEHENENRDFQYNFENPGLKNIGKYLDNDDLEEANNNNNDYPLLDDWSDDDEEKFQNDGKNEQLPNKQKYLLKRIQGQQKCYNETDIIKRNNILRIMDCIRYKMSKKNRHANRVYQKLIRAKSLRVK